MKTSSLVFLILLLCCIGVFLFVELSEKILLSKIMIGLAIGLIATRYDSNSGLES